VQVVFDTPAPAKILSLPAAAPTDPGEHRRRQECCHSEASPRRDAQEESVIAAVSATHPMVVKHTSTKRILIRQNREQVVFDTPAPAEKQIR